jgi:hypothetical protein
MTPEVPGFPGYTADDTGAVWCNGRRLSGYYDTNGQVWINGVLRAALVCSAFHGAPPTPASTVTHLNGVNDDDRPDNLAWS